MTDPCDVNAFFFLGSCILGVVCYLLDATMAIQAGVILTALESLSTDLLTIIPPPSDAVFLCGNFGVIVLGA